MAKYIPKNSDVKAADAEAQIICDIQHYASNHVSFDTGFVDSVEGCMERNGSITARQYNALVHVHQKFRMEKFSGHTKENKNTSPSIQ